MVHKLFHTQSIMIFINKKYRNLLPRVGNLIKRNQKEEKNKNKQNKTKKPKQKINQNKTEKNKKKEEERRKTIKNNPNSDIFLKYL